MANFVVAGQELTDRYLTETDIIDRYIGNQLWGTGRNGDGQLGTNDIVHRSSPVQTVSGGTNWVSIGSWQSFAGGIKTDGTLWMWGNNTDGVLGTNDITHRSSPVQTVSGGTNWKQFTGGNTHAAAIKTDGTLWVWGSNLYGNLGDNTGTSRSSPVQTVAAGKNWKQVSAGGYITAAIKTDGTLWSWGWNQYGQLADNTVVNRSSPVQTVSAGTNWKKVSAGGSGISAIKTDGTLWTWGYNVSGELGTNDTTYRSSPVQTISGGTNWKSVSCGSSRMGAIKTDGTLWMWGLNLGALADNTGTSRSSPVQTVSGGTNWKQLNCGGILISAIKTDGTLWAWGQNTDGQVGDGTVVRRSSPVQTVAAGTNWKTVSGCLALTFAES